MSEKLLLSMVKKASCGSRNDTRASTPAAALELGQRYVLCASWPGSFF